MGAPASGTSQWSHHIEMGVQLFGFFLFCACAFLAYISIYLRNKRAERQRLRNKLAVSGVMEGGGVAGLAAMRSKMAGRGRGLDPTRPLQRMEEGGAGRGLGGLKKSSSGGGGGSTGTLLESVRYLEQGGKLSSS